MEALIGYLTTRWEDEERVTKAASEPHRRSWVGGLDDLDLPYVVGEPDQGRRAAVAAPEDQEAAEHIAYWDPARVLAEVAAKRLRLAVIEHLLADDPTDETAAYLLRCEALPYADREGFRDEWRL